MNQWVAVHTQPRAEDKAAFHLGRQGFAVFLPKYLKRRSHARRIDWVPAPLFPRYLFVALDPERSRWRAIRSTVGVSELVCNGDRPAVVPDEVIAEIRARQDEKGLVAVARAAPFAPGERVEVTAGPMRTVSGIFECMSDEERVIVLLDLLGRQVRVSLPLAAVDACA
jgi:transcriptional antiterminator RfaH